MADEILTEYADYVAGLTLIPSGGGVFEVTIDDRLVFSKKELGRHAEEGEILRLFKEAVGITA